MRDKFFDSNILIYAQSVHDFRKNGIAQHLLIYESPVVSTQVLQESLNNYYRKLGFDTIQAENALDNLCKLCFVHINTIETIKNANRLKNQYRYSFYDSLIIAAALEANCTILYSEDMQHGHVIDNKLTIINPFL
jgi:predicted nucleic acid-binding protein